MRAVLGRLREAAPTRSGLLPVLILVLLLPFLVSPGERGSLAGDGLSLGVGPLALPTPGDRIAPPPPATSVRLAGADLPAPARAVSDEVRTVSPSLVVRPKAGIQAERLQNVLAIEGVDHLASASEVQVIATAPAGNAPLKVLVVDPLSFRPLTPEVTARTKGVWERLLDGEIVLRHDVAQRLKVPLGSTIGVTGPNNKPIAVRVGAFASNGTPPLADAVLPVEVGTRIGATAHNVLIVAVDGGQPPETVGKKLAGALGGGQVTPIKPPVRQRARLVGTGSGRFEPFSYVDHGDGMITIDPAWVRRWIVGVKLPIFRGVARCHRAMVPQLVAALQEIEDAGLANLIDPSQYGGCWVPRHIMFDPGKPLSMHAWGLAIDFNVSTNQYGARPRMDQRIVDIFERWGFRWGGHWSEPDGMHFELRAIVRP